MPNEVIVGEIPMRTPRRLLVVHESAELAEFLSEAGYEVAWAENGREALNVLRAQDYPMIIYHEWLRVKDGFHLMDQYKASAPSAFLIMADHPSTDSAVDALRHHAADYLAADMSNSEIRHRVDAAFATVDAARVHEDMISMVTHDIKVPLSSILGYCPLIFDKKTGEPHPRGQEFVRTIQSNANKILTLVDNYLTSCKIDSARFAVYFRPVQTMFLVQDLLSTFECEWPQHGLSFKSHVAAPLPNVSGDEALLFRALGNMLGNACKYTPEGGAVTFTVVPVDAGQSPLGRASLLFEVNNTCPGIDPSDLTTCFDKHTRGSRAQGIDGSGLGGYVLKSVALAHHGDVVARIDANGLTSFSMYLPVEGEIFAEEDMK